jgi:hypothetical protein
LCLLTIPATLRGAVMKKLAPVCVFLIANFWADGPSTPTFNFTSGFGEPTSGRIRVGKFVERCRKSLVIVGGRTGDRVVTADFVDNRLACSRGNTHAVEGALRGDPVAAMIRAIVDNKVRTSAGLMRADEAVGVLVALTRIREPIVARVKNGLPLAQYVAGTRAEEVGVELDLL